MSGKDERLAILGGPPAVPPDAHRRWPDITEEDRSEVMRVLQGEIWGIHGREVAALQTEFAEYCGARHCMAVTTGTAALRCAVAATGVGPGDEVIVPAVTYVASAMAVALAGATPVFCDVRPDTYTLDFAKVPSLITERTRAIMPVYLHGLATDSDVAGAIARHYGLPLIADAAQAAGATDSGHLAGSVATCTAFSLNGEKPFTAGEGGLVTCNDAGVYKALRRFACLGEDRPVPRPGEVRVSRARYLGDQFRMNELTAALARSQLTRLASYLSRARRNAAILVASLAELPGVYPPHEPENCQSSHYRFRVRLNPAAFGWDGDPVECRDRVLAALIAEGLAADAWGLLPIPAHPAFRRDVVEAWHPRTRDTPLRPWKPDDYPVASALLGTSITLGAHPYPLHVQTERVMGQYAAGFAKVSRNIDAVLTGPYAPLRTAPPIPASELQTVGRT